MDKFENPSSSIRDAAREIGTGKTEGEKLEKLYASVMKLENTSFTRQHTAEENNAEGVKQVKSAQDIWELKRGNSDDLTLLFIALARAAGFKAYAMEVVNRDTDLFQKGFLNSYQFDDLVAIVVVDGKEFFFDPGQRYCNFGQLHWKHTYAGGLRQKDGGTELATTPGGGYKDTQTHRIADLTIGSHGEVSGKATFIYTGAVALHWRQKALESDETEVRKEFEESVQAEMPPGVIVTMNHFVGLDTYGTVLMATMDVSGSMGTSTQKRIFLPTSFFEAGRRPLFAHATREYPIDLKYPYASKDEITLHLPAGVKAESTPGTAKVSYPQMAVLQTTSSISGQTVNYTRTLVIANTLFNANEYADLKGFLDKVSATDQQQTVLQAQAPGQEQGQ